MTTMYPFNIRDLTKEDGGGFLIEFPYLPGCMSDGDTIQEAIINGQDVVSCWLETAKSQGRSIPKPTQDLPSGKWLQRVPKTLHGLLIEQAKREGVGLNTLVISLLSLALGLKSHHKNHPIILMS